MGTKMMLHRYSPVTKDWDETLYVVDQDFLDTYGNLDSIIPTGYVYEPDKGLLKVYLNGQRLNNGGAYLEVDDFHIKLTLGSDENGNPFVLSERDEIYIEVYKNQYCSRGQSTISGTQFYALEREITDARKFKETDVPFQSIDARLDFIQRSIELIENGMANVDIEYEHNGKDQITKQIITGEYELTREFVFNEIDEISIETITYQDFSVVKTHTYDMESGRLLQTRVRIS